MGLGSIVARVENELQYAPQVATYKSDIREVTKARYMLLCKEKDWPWLHRRTPLYVFPDLTIENSAVSMPGAPNYGSRTFLMNDTVFSTYYSTVGDWITRIRPHLAGAEFGVVNASLSFGGAANWEDGPFVIELAESYPTSPPARTLLHLDPRCTIPAIAGTEGSYQIRFMRYLLPPDVDRILQIVDEQGTPLGNLEPGWERRAGLLQTAAGQRPGWVLEDFGHTPTHPRLVYPGLSNVIPSNPDQTDDVYQRTSLPVRVPPSLNFQGSSGAWLAGTTVRVFFAWFYSNRWGPAGPISEATCSSSTNQLDVSGYMQQGLLPSQATAALGAYGRRLGIFVSEDLTNVSGRGQGPSAFYLRASVNPGDSSGTPITTIVEPRDSSASSTSGALRPNGALDLPRFDRLYPGLPQYVRLYPRPSAVARYEIDYIGRPFDLLEDMDGPEFHGPFEEVLVYATCIELAKRYARSADLTVWERNYAEWFGKLVSHYIPDPRYSMIKGALGSAPESPMFTASMVRAPT